MSLTRRLLIVAPTVGALLVGVGVGSTATAAQGEALAASKQDLGRTAASSTSTDEVAASLDDAVRGLLRELRATAVVDVAPVDPTATEVAATTPAPVAAPTAAPAPAPAPPSTRPRHEEIGAQAMARLRHADPADMGWRVVFHAGRSGYLGMADQDRKVLDVWVRADHDVNDILATVAHELAHAYDYDVWTDDVRRQWLRLRGLQDVTWWPTCTCDDRAHGAGDIAEALAVLEAGPQAWTGVYAPPTAAQLQWLADLLD